MQMADRDQRTESASAGEQTSPFLLVGQHLLFDQGSKIVLLIAGISGQGVAKRCERHVCLPFILVLLSRRGGHSACAGVAPGE